MTRIIAGSAGGRRLRVPSGSRTRPTADRVREALFSTILSTLGSITGLRFLDLYAGSGAVGLEAMSRGAGAVLLVESHRSTAALIAANARELGLTVDVRSSPVSTVMSEPPAAPFDVVFSDPPYQWPAAKVRADLAALVTAGWLSPGALVAVERASRDGSPDWPPGLAEERFRRYGDTTLWYGREAGER